MIGTYGQYGDKVRKYLINPDIFALLKDVRGLRVLDAGCGEGYLCRLFAGSEAASVCGLDLCVPLLSRARNLEAADPLGISYILGDYQHMVQIKDNSFDRVVANMVLMDLPDFRSAIRESARVLSPTGVFIFSILHPSFITSSSDWCQTGLGSNAWTVDNYFGRQVSEQRFASATSTYRFEADERPPFMFHRPIADYVEALAESEFVITGLKEAEPASIIREDADASPGEGRISWYLTIRAQKLDYR
ncbi:MAG: class I SAM-dependent methyltransferase [Pyrinomonadaceae bacterium]